MKRGKHTVTLQGSAADIERIAEAGAFMRVVEVEITVQVEENG